MQIVLVLVLLFALLVAVFSAQNVTPVDIHFLSWRFPGISLGLIILGSVALGAVLAFLLGLGKQIGLSRQLRESRQEGVRLQDKLAQLQKETTPQSLDQTAPLPPLTGRTNSGGQE